MVSSVSEFLECLQAEIELLRSFSHSNLFVYRGEPKQYDTHGMPNLFRGDTAKSFQEYSQYEKNILDEFISHGFSSGKNYLQTAIDAQHGGFPSRLLDVSFNSLVALFFAVHDPQSEHAEENAVVYIYAVDKLYSPSSENIQLLYNQILNGELSKDRIAGYNHIYIDYINSNKRIISQKGGFILFPGKEYVPLPPSREKFILIDHRSKRKILNDLNFFFGINVGNIYPESNNNVDYLGQKALHLSNAKVTGQGLISSFIAESIETYRYYISRAYSCSDKILDSLQVSNYKKWKIYGEFDSLLSEFEIFNFQTYMTFKDFEHNKSALHDFNISLDGTADFVKECKTIISENQQLIVDICASVSTNSGQQFSIETIKENQ
ncbi:MAG: FRG domain-containing protein [Bifidobacterium sp.]|uniref:FRG domain-containing protein n=1 Tax=Bifidobacterium sp. TaxID=41200 RepID=UPI0039EB4AC7